MIVELCAWNKRKENNEYIGRKQFFNPVKAMEMEIINKWITYKEMLCFYCGDDRG